MGGDISKVELMQRLAELKLCNDRFLDGIQNFQGRELTPAELTHAREIREEHNHFAHILKLTYGIVEHIYPPLARTDDLQRFLIRIKSFNGEPPIEKLEIFDEYGEVERQSHYQSRIGIRYTTVKIRSNKKRRIELFLLHIKEKFGTDCELYELFPGLPAQWIELNGK